MFIDFRCWCQRYWQVLKGHSVFNSASAQEPPLLSVFLEFELHEIATRLEAIEQAFAEQHYDQVLSRVMALDGDPTRQRQVIAEYEVYMARYLHEAHQLYARAVRLRDRIELAAETNSQTEQPSSRNDGL